MAVSRRTRCWQTEPGEHRRRRFPESVTRRHEGERESTIGPGTWFGSGCWLNAIGGTITVGDGCSFAGDVTISAAAAVTLGRDVLVARGSGGVLGGLVV